MTQPRPPRTSATALPGREHPRADTEPSAPPDEMPRATEPPLLSRPPRATDRPEAHAERSAERFDAPTARSDARTRGVDASATEPPRPPEASGVRRIPAALPRPGTPGVRLPKLPYARREIVPPVDESARLLPPLPSAPPGSLESVHRAPTLPTPARGTDGLSGPLHSLPELARTESAQLPEVDLDLASSRLRTRGTPRTPVAHEEQIRTLVYAPDRKRLAWIERELSHAPITIQVGRRARTIVAALVRDPPPRPDVLIVDFDAVAPAELAELAALAGAAG
jgi:hypothetical protein